MKILNIQTHKFLFQTTMLISTLLIFSNFTIDNKNKDIKITNIPMTDRDIARQFISSSPTDGYYCSVSGGTMRDFGPDEIMTNGIVDPYFNKGGFMMGRSTGNVKAYVICVDFDDCPGAGRITYGDLQNVFVTNGMEYDYSDPETFYKVIFTGSEGFGKSFTGTREYDGIIKYLDQISYGKMKFDVDVLNSRVKDDNGRWQWFRLPGEQRDYSIQYASGVEDYRTFARLHQAAINIAYNYINDLDLSDIDFLYVTTPVNTFGFRSGLQGGAGIETSFSSQDQSLILRNTEFRHAPGVITKEGRVIGSGCTITKGARGYRSDENYWRVLAHETAHGLGLTDDYTYSSTDHYSPTRTITYNGRTTEANSWSAPVGNWGIVGGMTGPTPDWQAWYKYKAGWFDDEGDVVTVKPGTKEQIITISALASKKDGYNQGAKMVLIPTEWRTINTFHNTDIWGTPIHNPWNKNETKFNFLDWFTPLWVGGETHAVKSFPTGYVLECRRAVEADRGGTAAAGSDRTDGPGKQGILITQLDNLTWETGHGAAGLKTMRNLDVTDNNIACIGAGDYKGASKTSPSVWEDKIRGIKIEVIESTQYYDKVKITYNDYDIINKDYKSPSGDVVRKYQGVLKLSDNYVVNNESFNINFNLFTLGRAAASGERIYEGGNAGWPSTIEEAGDAKYIGSPLGVPAGITKFTMEVSFDPSAVMYTGKGNKSPFDLDINAGKATKGMIIVKGTTKNMIDGDILELGFKTASKAKIGEYTVTAKITSLEMKNYWGATVKTESDIYPSIDAVGKGYESREPGMGLVVITAKPTHNISGMVKVIAVDGIPVGVEAEVKLCDGNGKNIAVVKSDFEGYYYIPNVPEGRGYYLTFEKLPAYEKHTSAAFDVSDDTFAGDATLSLLVVKVSGYVYGDNSGNPLPGAKVRLKDGGFINAGSEAATNSEGYYEITDAPVMVNEFYTLTASYPGYGNNFGPNYGIDKGDLFAATSDVSRNITLTSKYSISGVISPNEAADAAHYIIQLYDVKNKPTGLPVKGAEVRNGNTVIRNYVIENVPPGKGYYIEVKCEGYKTQKTTPFDIISSNVLRKNITLTK